MPSAIDFFLNHVRKVLPEFTTTQSKVASSEIRLTNSEYRFDADLKYNLVISSPPYGDRSTTVAYGQFSSFGNEWTRGLNPFNEIDYVVDREGLGKRAELIINSVGFKILDSTLERVHDRRPSRARDVALFFNGLYRVLSNVVEHLTIGGYACFVVGNRTVAGIEIPLDQITAEFLTQFGMEILEIRTRAITNKVMPLENSTSNIPGRLSRTMTTEYVVVSRKRGEWLVPLENSPKSCHY